MNVYVDSSVLLRVALNKRGARRHDHIVSQQKLEEISRAYKRTASCDVETLNSRRSLSVS